MFTKAQNEMFTKTSNATIEERNPVTFVVKIWVRNETWGEDVVLTSRMFETKARAEKWAMQQRNAIENN
jgi:hypothetical protein